MTANVCIAYGDLVNAEMIPGDDIYPESVASAATTYSTAGTAVTEKGAAVLTQWQGLAGVYTAPESGELFAVMDPVSVNTTAIGGTLTSVSGIVSNFADAVAPIKSRLLALKEEAATFAASVIDGVSVDIMDKDHPARDAGLFSLLTTDFADMAPTTIPWDQHQESVEINKDIIGRINTEVAALDAAQAEAVNAINALRTDVCLAEVVPLTADDLNAEGMVLPYGTASDGDKGCWQSTNDGIETAFVGMGEGAGALFGYNATTGDWGDGETAAAAWRGMGMTVAGVALLGGWGLAATLIPDEHVPTWLKGADDFAEEAMDHVANAGKALVAVDMWSENPAEAFGTTLVNVGTFFIPGGAVVGGLKAGTVAARAASIAGHAVDFVLPGAAVASRVVTGTAIHAGSGLTALTTALKGSLTTGVSAGRGALAQTLNSLGDSMPSVRVEPGYSVALPGGGVSLPGPGRIVIGEPGSGGGFLHSLAERVDANTTTGTSGTPASSGTPATSGITPGASGTGTARPAAGGAVESPADAPATPTDVAETATNGPAPAAVDAAPDGTAGNSRPADGGAMDRPDDALATRANSAESTADGSTPATANAAPAVAPGPNGSAPGGAADAPTDAPATPADPAEAAADSTTPTAPDSVPVPMKDGSTHTPVFTDQTIAQGYESFESALPAILENYGVTSDHFAVLVHEPIVNLTKSEISLLIDVRDALPSPTLTDLLQKVIPHDVGTSILHGAKGVLAELKGFVSRPVDLLGLSNREVHDVLGLNYLDKNGAPSSFTNDLVAGRSYFDVRFDATSVRHPLVPDSPIRWMEQEVPPSILDLSDPVAKAQAIQAQWDRYSGDQKIAFERKYPSLGHDLKNALDPKNPFRGSGFSGTGANFSPEGTFGQNTIDLPAGAELWRTRPDGQREFLGVYSQPRAGAPASWVLADSASPRELLLGIGLRPTSGIGTALKGND